jgi:ABC-2 type transport system permease protein
MSIFPPRSYELPYEAERPAFLWLLEREVVRFLKIWRFTIAGQAISALMFVVVFGIALAGHISGLAGMPYDRYILPGLVVQAVITVGFINGTTTLYEARHDRYIHNVLASPLRWWEINAALVCGGIVREVLTGGIVLAVAMPVTGAGVAHPVVAILATIGLLVVSAQIGVLVGSYCKTVDHIYSIETLVVLPLGFLSGTFYSIGRLPEGWRILTHLNPLFYFVDAFRSGLLGGGDLPVGLALAVILGTALVLSVWSAVIFRSGSQLKP